MNQPEPITPRLLDLHPSRGDFLAEVHKGLSSQPPWLSALYFYDERGSHLFDQICKLPEYYPTRIEKALLHDHAAEIAAAIGPRVSLIEPGSGSGEKARIVLNLLEDPVAFVPVEISREHLMNSATALASEFPKVEILPVCADFSEGFELPIPTREPDHAVVFFPGSTLGNFEPAYRTDLMAQFARVVGEGGQLLLGYDLRKDPSILLPAYDDAAGVTAEFNLNLFRRMQRELSAELDLDHWKHEARWDDELSRVEMHMVATADTTIRVDGREYEFRAGESIHSENSYKFTREGLADLATGAGFRSEAAWEDSKGWFRVELFRRI